VSVREQCDIFYAHPPAICHRPHVHRQHLHARRERKRLGRRFAPSIQKPVKVRWEYKEFSRHLGRQSFHRRPSRLHRDVDGYLIALDADTGKPLWHIQTGAAIYAAPITYQLNAVNTSPSPPAPPS